MPHLTPRCFHKPKVQIFGPHCHTVGYITRHDDDQGPDALYQLHSEDLASEIRAAGGIMTADDLRSATPVIKDALSTQVSPPSYIAYTVQVRDCSLSTPL